VVDGDTVDLANGERVRLVGVDTPEVGECGFEEAGAFLERLVLGERVQLTASDEDRDAYGRLLRYVDVGGTDVGLRLIRRGYAEARYDSRDGYGFHPREPRYVRADATSADSGCASSQRTNPQPTSPRPTSPQPLVQQPTGGCTTGYEPCLPPGPPDLDCADVGGPVRVTGDDPHALDRDGDGTACE
jgi:endonuclease YncB( thermonuclease family)